MTPEQAAELKRLAEEYVDAVQAEIAALRRKLEDARKDAERYRWLTCNAYVGIAPYPTPHEVWCMRLPNPANCHNLDAAIDAAMTNEG